VVVDCTGSPAGLTRALRLVRPRGTIVLKSTYPGLAEADLTSVVVHEVTLVGSRCGPFPTALRLLTEGQVQVRPLIAARYPLSEALRAFDHAARPGTLKVLMEVERNDST
jgi:threonine dehydrogenase-like Zn-dependent dehydrogenase